MTSGDIPDDSGAPADPHEAAVTPPIDSTDLAPSSEQVPGAESAPTGETGSADTALADAGSSDETAPTDAAEGATLRSVPSVLGQATPDAAANPEEGDGDAGATGTTDGPSDDSSDGGAASAEVLSEDDLLDADAESEPEPADNPWTRPGKWYVVHTQSGYEKKVKQNLEARTHSMNMEHRIHEVVIPMEDVVEFKAGKKQVVQKKMFPGYLLVRCRLDDDSWFVIRNTPGVTGFVGQGAKPSPLPRRDVMNFLQVKKEGEEVQRKGKARLEYEMGETVRVKEGPFAEFSGEIIEINEDQLKVKVLVNLFGRETPVELEFSQVAKL